VGDDELHQLVVAEVAAPRVGDGRIRCRGGKLSPLDQHDDRIVDAEELLASQREFYDLRAPDYGDVTRPGARRLPGVLGPALARRLVERFAPSGDVLELACGPGGFTRELVRHARSLTAVDASPRMLERNRTEVGDDRVEYIHADLFDWRPPRQYDAVFFGFWLSHVPPTHFDSFWSLVRSCLQPGGRAGFVDEDDRGEGNETLLVEGPLPAARRTLSDGREFDIVKLYWRPADLVERLESIGWRATVEPIGETFLYGTAQPVG
jgi:SAM-dependent methyltransferase